MRIAFSIKLIALFGLLAAAGCVQTPTQQLTGTLHSVRPASGGAPTGWVLEMGMGGGGYAMPLDVSAVKSEAEQLDGKKVMVTAENKMGGSQQMWIVKKIGMVSQ